MPTKITMPQLGESVAEGTIGRWLKQEGDMVKRDESLVEIVTDKVTAELPSPVSGRLAKILVGDDQTVKVGVEIAEIDESGASSGATSGSTATSATSATSATTAATATTSAAMAPSGNGSGGAVATEAMQASPTPVASANGASTSNTSNGSGSSSRPNGAGTLTAPRATATADKVSPLARRIAQEQQIDLAAVPGTGEGGRVRKEDILAYVAQRAQAQPISAGVTTAAVAAPSQAAPTASTATTAAEGDELITPTPARRAIAEHMVRSKQTSPHATTLVEVDMTTLGRWLDQHKYDFKRREGYGISFQTFAIKATVEALKQFPYMNASWTEDNKIVLRKQIHIGVSIALPNNLIVPVIRNADTLSLAGIARTVSDLVGRARSNRLMPADLQGGTFTVNNPGVFGTLISMAIINQPNAGILTTDVVEKRPVVVDDAIAIRQMMYMSLSFDHRVLDGMTAAQFLGAIKHRLETWGPEIEVY
ncbi:MAG: dihydrolipoamide acetyltransferase family protein [Ktedonobacterales bacterium]